MLGPKRLYLIVAVILFPTAAVLADDDPATLFDFSKPDAANQWQTVNDGVMGGVSDGRLRVSDQGIMEFFGTLSLENNGGFASVRSKAKALELKDGDVIVARIRGDGRDYYFNLQVPTRRIAFSYRASFKTKAGEWQEIKVPLKEFQATSFGRPVREAGPVEADKVNSIGFLLADKKAGPFKLAVEWIRVVRATADEL
jgi:monofunctional biosynthetic peptidoglycan transglycosylase